MTRRRLLAVAGAAAFGLRAGETAVIDRASSRLPAGLPPDLGCWFWGEREFAGDGWRAYLDEMAAHSPFGLLTTSLRYPEVEVTDPAVRDRIAAAAEYARGLGIGLVMDLDVRLARREFQRRWPDELQQMLRCRELRLDGDQPVVCRIEAAQLSDHYTHRTTPYVSLDGGLARVWRYRPGYSEVEEITDSVELRAAGAEAVELAIAPAAGWLACVAVWFTHLTPDVFAPHLIAFERSILDGYRDVPLAGVCKDEWGFPPDFGGVAVRRDLWSSAAYDAAYQAVVGRSLLDDALLLTHGPDGERRREAVDAYQRLGRERCVAVENAYYDNVKEVFGPSAFVGTHATWFPWPGRLEAKKNGLDWWQVRRDWAQTDEVTPLGCRTALAKKWRSPVWYNMYYDRSPESYARELWSAALSGGRVNIHPCWPVDDPVEGTRALLRGGLMRGLCRVRLLNYISQSPLDCPVAVVFGHDRLINWAGEGYGDSGWETVAGPLWRMGFPCDLIPSSELGEFRTAQGALWYGPQHYAAIGLYHCDGLQSTEQTVVAATDDPHDLVGPVLGHGIPPVTPAVVTPGLFGVEHIAPPRAGEARLIDGTSIFVRAEHDAAGDRFAERLSPAGQAVEVEAAGLLAVRFDDRRLVALAAGGLRRFRCRDLELSLAEPLDLALWRDDDGWAGVLQGWDGPVPPDLLRLTDRWQRLGVPRELGA